MYMFRVSVAALLCCVGLHVSAQSPRLGEPINDDDLGRLDLVILPDGSNLPTGSGSVSEGAGLYREHCIACHAPGGVGGVSDRLVGGRDTLDTSGPIKTIGSYWPFATTIFDYVRRAMPYTRPGTLSDNEVYALTAYLLHLNGVIEAGAELDAALLRMVEMPNKQGFVWVVN